MTGDLRQFVEGLLLVIAALLPIVNPFGGAPVFLAMTADCTAALRATLAQKIAVNAFVLLLASLFIGTYVLEFFGLSVPIVQVAGGIVVCANAWELLRAESATSDHPCLGAGRRGDRQPGLLSADPAAHRRTRHHLGRDHASARTIRKACARWSCTAPPT